jgi:glucose-1-phosphate thymidylyltransferase
MKKWAGIILAGGSATRLLPVSSYISKHLLPIYDRPMIFYPIHYMKMMNIKNVMIISNEKDNSIYQKLLGNGKNFGLKFIYKKQEKPNGIAEAFIIAKNFIKNKNTVLVLGDNIFMGKQFLNQLTKEKQKFSGSTIFVKKVKNPKRFGVVKYKNKKIVQIIEKPKKFISFDAVTGIYFYDSSVYDKAKKLKPSKRNELEITDINNMYIQDNKLSICKLNKNISWVDAGTFDSLLHVSNLAKKIIKK